MGGKPRQTKLPERIALLEQELVRARPSYVRGLRPGLTSVRLSRLRERVPYPLPETLLELYAWHDGSLNPHAAFDGEFAWHPSEHALHHKSVGDQLEAIGAFGHWRRGSWWNSGWFPFLQYNTNDRFVCVDLNGSLRGNVGEVFIWQHNHATRTVLASSVDTWLEGVISILQRAPALRDDRAVAAHFSARAMIELRGQIAPDYPAWVDAEPSGQEVLQS